MEFHMGADGNVVLTDDSHAVWANGEAGNSGATLTMQPGGNLVEKSANGTVIWNAGTGGDSRSYLLITAYGWPRVLYQGSIVWQSSPGHPYNYFDPGQADVLFAPGTLGAPGQTMYDAKQGYSLYEYEGWLEEYVNNTTNLVWYAGSYCAGTSSANMQSDGNLVIYCNGTATWSSGTGGHPSSYGFYLHLLTSGELVIQSNFGTVEWSNGV